MNFIKHIYYEQNITPDYIIICKKNGDKKCIYQKNPKQLTSNFNGIEISHNIYAQNTLNIKDLIDNCDHIIFVTNDEEIIIKDNFIISNMLDKIKNTNNQTYTMSYLFNTPIYISDDYLENTQHKSHKCLNKIMLILYGSVVISSMYTIHCLIKGIKLIK
jgi:hypothetical protein